MMIFLWILVGLFGAAFSILVGYLYGRESLREELDEAKNRLPSVLKQTNIMTPNEVREIVAKNSPEPKPCSFTSKEQGDLELLKQKFDELSETVRLQNNQRDAIDHATEVVDAFASRLKRVERKAGLNT